MTDFHLHLQKDYQGLREYKILPQHTKDIIDNLFLHSVAKEEGVPMKGNPPLVAELFGGDTQAVGLEIY